MDENNEKQEEQKKIEKSNTNSLLIIFFLVLFILLFTGVIVMTLINNSLKQEIEELKALTNETEIGIEKIENTVNSKIEKVIENIVSSENVNETIVENTVENKVATKNDKPKKVEEIYRDLDSRFSNFMYRRDDGLSAGFFVKDGVLYSGIEEDASTNVKTTGIEGTPKYIVPLDKQLGKTIVLTKEGKVFVNKKDSTGLYGVNFESYLEEYTFVEIIELGEVYKLYLVTNTGKVLDVETGIEFKD